MEFLRNFQKNWIEKYTQSFLRVATIGAILLHVMRVPTWTYTHPQWANLSLYPAVGISKLPAGPGYILTFLLLLINQWCVHTMLFIPSARAKIGKSRLKVLYYGALPLTAIKLLDSVIQVIVFYSKGRTYWSLSPWEALIFIVCEPCFESRLYKTMYRSLSYFGGLMFLFVTVIMAWTVLELTLIEHKDDIDEVSRLDGAMWEMLMILNTADWPTPTMPAYYRGTINFVFYIAYSVVCDWGFLNLVLGLIVAFFEEAFTAPSKEQLAKEAKDRADDVVETVGGGSGDTPTPLRSQSIVINTANPLNSGAEGAADSSDSRVPSETFEIEEVDHVPSSSEAPSWLISVANPVVEHKYFGLTLDLVFAVMGFNFLFGPDPATILNIQIVLNTIELIVRLSVRKGTLYEWSCNFRNISNAIFITVLVSHTSLYFWMCSKKSNFDLEDKPCCQTAALVDQITPQMDGVVVWCIIIIRTCLIMRILLISRNFTYDYLPTRAQKHLIRAKNIVLETSDALGHLVIMLLTTMYIFASIGEKLYGGKLSKDPSLPGYEALMSSVYGQSEYWPLNFNDSPSAMLSMFTILYINNMQIITAGCVAVTSQNSQLFFGAFYVIGVLYVRNVFTSFLWSRIGKILDPECDPIEDDEPELALIEGETAVDKAAKDAKKAEQDRLSNLPAIPALEGLKDLRSAGLTDAKAKVALARKDADKNTAPRPSVIDNNPRESFVDVMLQTTNDTHDFEDGLGKGRDIRIEEDLGVILHNARYGDINEPFHTRRALWAFKWRSRLYHAVLISCWLLTLVRVFQTPPWVLDAAESGKILDNYWFSDVPLMTQWLTAVIKVPLLLTLQGMLMLEFVSKKDMKKISKASHVMRYVMIAICFTSMITLFISLAGNSNARRVDWYLSFFSVFYTFWFDKNAMKRVVIVFGVIPKLMVLLIIFGVFVALAALFACIMFDAHDFHNGDDDYNQMYYEDYTQSVWSTFTALTSSSFPQQFMPGTRAYREFAIYFVGVVAMGGFVILEGSIAVVNQAYQYGVVASNNHIAKAKKNALAHVFDFISDEVDRITAATATATATADSSDSGKLSTSQKHRASHAFADTGRNSAGGESRHSSTSTTSHKHLQVASASIIDDLMNEIFTSYGEFAKKTAPSAPERAVLRTMLDIDGDGHVCKGDFQYLYHVVRMTVKKVKKNFLTKREKEAFKDEKKMKRAILMRSATGWDKFEATARLTREKYSASLYRCVASIPGVRGLLKKHWYMLMDTICGLLGLMRSLTDGTVVVTIGYVLASVMLVEFIFKWFMMGRLTYFRDTRNCMDFVIMVSLYTTLIVGGANGSLDNGIKVTNKEATIVVMDIVTMMRLFLYPRNVAIFSAPVNGVAWKSIFSTVSSLSFAFAEVFTCLGFTFAQLGVLLFGGLIPKAGIIPALDKSPFGLNNFYILNFNDMTSAFFTLFACLRISDWDVVTQGYVQVTGYEHWRAFFAMWYVFGVLLMLNILKSYFVVVFRSRPRKSADDPVSSHNDSQQTHLPHEGDGEGYIDKEITQRNIRSASSVATAAKKEGLSAPEEDEEEESERLEKRNVGGQFIVDLADVIARPDYVATPADKANFTDQIAEIRNLRQAELAARASRALNSSKSPKGGIDNAMMNEFRSKPSMSVDESQESTAERARARNEFRFVVKFPFKNGMDPAERLPILRRLEQLSMS